MIRILLRRKNLKLTLIFIFCFILLQLYINVCRNKHHSNRGTTSRQQIAKRCLRKWGLRAHAHFEQFASFIYNIVTKILTALKYDKVSEQEYYSPRLHTTTNLTVRFLDNGTTCSKSELEPPLAVVIILSTWEYSARRAVIRSTWASGDYDCPLLKDSASASWTTGNGSLPGIHLAPKQFWKSIIRYAFIVGLPTDARLRDTTRAVLEKESREHGDIVLVDLRDTYRNLTLKVLTGLRWAADVCAGAHYVIKTDHDVFMHVPRLVQVVTQPEHRDVIVGGYANGGGFFVFRGGPYGIPYEAYPFDSGYPEHVKGGIYFMNMTTARALLRVAAFMPLVGIEDVHVTGERRAKLHFSVTPRESLCILVHVVPA